MPNRIEEDHKHFRDVVSGRIRKELKKFIKQGQIIPRRAKNGKVSISIPQIDIPHFLFGDNGQGLGRGDGNEGDVIGRKQGQGQGNGAGEGESEGITITLNLEEVLKFMENELELPRLQPKQSVLEDEKIKYNNISLIGPESLRHNRRTMLQAMKRLASTGDLDKLHLVPGHKDPMPLITPENQDKRYRQYKIIREPSSNAVVFYARDGSGSMDDQKCGIISDMVWWMDVWIKRFYKRVERVWVWHDSAAQEVDEEKFYRLRMGGGTNCSSAMKYIGKQFDNRFPPEKWNVYVFYFTDGDNWDDDNPEFIRSLKEELGPDRVNVVGITQIMSYSYEASLKKLVDDMVESNELNGDFVRTCAIGRDENGAFTDERRNTSILDGIRTLLGKPGGVFQEEL